MLTAKHTSNLCKPCSLLDRSHFIGESVAAAQPQFLPLLILLLLLPFFWFETNTGILHDPNWMTQKPKLVTCNQTKIFAKVELKKASCEPVTGSERDGTVCTVNKREFAFPLFHQEHFSAFPHLFPSPLFCEFSLFLISGLCIKSNSNQDWFHSFIPALYCNPVAVTETPQLPLFWTGFGAKQRWRATVDLRHNCCWHGYWWFTVVFRVSLIFGSLTIATRIRKCLWTLVDVWLEIRWSGVQRCLRIRSYWSVSCGIKDEDGDMTMNFEGMEMRMPDDGFDAKGSSNFGKKWRKRLWIADVKCNHSNSHRNKSHLKPLHKLPTTKSCHSTTTTATPSKGTVLVQSWK